MAAKCMSKKAAKWVFWIFAAVFVVSVVFLLIFPSIFQTLLKKESTLVKGSMLTGVWTDPPLPLYERIYFFNITNRDEFLNHGAKLNVTQVGPYTYEGRWVKKHPIWNSNGTVTYHERRTYHFKSELSTGTEDDTIVTLNGPMLMGVNLLRKYERYWAIPIIASFLLKLASEEVIIEKTVRELVYEGYKDPILKIGPVIIPDIPLRDGRFAWLYGKNDTFDGEFTVFTGEDDQSKTNIINTYNGRENLEFWKGETCNMINGTSIETGPPLKENQQTYTFFQSLLCKSWDMNYTSDQNLYGLHAKRFLSTPMIFANSTDNPDNACFEVNGPVPSGTMDLSSCQFGASAYLSFPHFFMADKSYFDFVDGLNPKEEDHISYLDVEPITGLTVGVKMRFQLNLGIKKMKGIFQLDNVNNGIYPVLWAELEIKLTEEWAHYFLFRLKTAKVIVFIVLGILTVIAFGIMVGTILVWRPWAKDEDENDPLLDIKEEEKANISKRKVTLNEESSPNPMNS